MHRQAGFTLIELMIVVAIVAIIAAIAIPAYQEQVRKARRADAVKSLGQLQLELERWRAENPCYGQPGSTGCPAAFTVSGTYPDANAFDTTFYDVSIAATGAATYRITASPRNAQADDRCKVLTLQHDSNGKPTWEGEASCN